MSASSKQSKTATKTLQIGDLARATGTSAKTIRFYEEAGVLPQPQRAENGYRLYGEEDIRRLRFVRNARSLDFSLDDLQEVLALRDQGQAPCRYVIQLLEEKSVEVEERIHQLRLLQKELQLLLDRAGDLPDDDIEMKHCICHLIYNR